MNISLIHKPILKRSGVLVALILVSLVFIRIPGVQAQEAPAAPNWIQIWGDEFNSSGAINSSNWICDTGHQYLPNGPWNWGTGEIQAYTCSTDNLFQDGQNLNIRALHSAKGWTSGRIETVRQDFQPNPNGILAVEARIKLPEVNNTTGLGYWPAFWMLGEGYRKDYWSWPSVGEIDIMENVNGLNRWWGVLHCGPVDYNRLGNPCNEPTGIAKDVSGFDPTLQSAFHTYRLEFDKTVSPQQLRWYVDGSLQHTVNSTRFDTTTWNSATNHGFFILLNLAMGGGFPDAFAPTKTPTGATISGGTMQVDYVRVYHTTERVTAGVFRPSNGVIFLKNTNTTGYADIAINYGLGGDYPIAGDWDGDGIDSIGVYRCDKEGNGTFYLRNSNTVGYANVYFPFNPHRTLESLPTPCVQPVAGDWDGDGIDTIGVYDSRDITFYLRNSNTAGPADHVFRLGIPGDIGIAGDWNGDGKDTTGVFRPGDGVIYLKNTNETGYADIAINYGIGGDRPLTGDWDNDGIDSIGVLRGNTFYLRNSNTVGYADMYFDLGIPGDMPIAGDWDGLP